MKGKTAQKILFEKKKLISKSTFELENLFVIFKGPADERQNDSKNYLDGIFGDSFCPNSG